jgi:aconitate hydratase
VTEFKAVCRIDTPVEIEYYRNGGILHTVLRNMLTEGDKAGRESDAVAAR